MLPRLVSNSSSDSPASGIPRCWVYRLEPPRLANINFSTNILNHDIYCYRTNSIRYYLCSSSNPNCNHCHLMRKLKRTIQCKTLFPVLHTDWLFNPTHSINLYPKFLRLTKFLKNHYWIQTWPNPDLMSPMISIHNSIPSKNTPLPPPPLTTKSACRSPNRSQLLKLGGCSIKWNFTILNPLTEYITHSFLILSLGGTIVTALFVYTKQDLKSLIAYSSISLVALVKLVIFILMPWSVTGATALIIVHGLMSSMLLCLKNSIYEGIHSWTILLALKLHVILPLIQHEYWLANLSSPTTTMNLIGKLLVVIALFLWSSFTTILIGLNILITALYSLYILNIIRWGKYTHHINNIKPAGHGGSCL